MEAKYIQIHKNWKLKEGDEVSSRSNHAYESKPNYQDPKKLFGWIPVLTNDFGKPLCNAYRGSLDVFYFRRPVGGAK